MATEPSKPKNSDVVLLVSPDHPSRNPPETPKPTPPNPETPKPQTSSPSRPPRPPTATSPSAALLRRRSTLSKPKSRFVEPSPPPASSHPSPAHPAAATTPLTPAADADDDDDVVSRKDAPTSSPPAAARLRRKIGLALELSVLILFLALLVVSLVVRPLQGRAIWGLEIWKWCVLVIAAFSGRLVSQWLVTFVVFLIERNFLLRNKVLYFVFGLKNSVKVCLWLALVLIAWSLLFDQAVGRPPKTAKILSYVSRFLASLLIGSVIWVVKTFVMKVIASSFHRKAFFDRIQESVYHQYVLQTLSGPPVMELAENVGREGSGAGWVSIGRGKEEKGGAPEVIDVARLRMMSQEKVSAWTMKGLITAIRSSGLSTISHTIESFHDADAAEQKDKEISSEWEAKAAAHIIFKNVARPGYK